MNKNLFIDGYLKRISQKFKIDKDKAFEVFSVATILDMPFDEVYNDVVVKDGDGGIDGAIITQQGESYTLFLIQCKNSKGLKQNEIEKFIRDAEEIFSKGKKKLNSNGLNKVIDEYKQLTDAGNIIELKLYFVYQGNNSDSERKGNKQLFNEFNGKENLRIWDSDTLYQSIDKLIKSQNNRKQIQYTFQPEKSNLTSGDSAQQALYTYWINNIIAANFRISALELCKLVDQEIKTNGNYDFLFSENIRGWLGFGPRPNKRMRETLEDINDSRLFPILNNGVTIICEQLTIPTKLQDGKYNLPTVNPVIVNGQQTTKVLYEVYKLDVEKLIDVFVNVRIYETQDESLIDKITDATNTQNPINFRDKISNKPFNKYTKEIFENNQVAYITKKGETFSNKISKAMGEAVDSDTVLKFWYATFYEKPEIAKVSIAKVLTAIYDATVGDNKELLPLFDGNKDSPIYNQLFHSYTIYKYVKNRRREDMKNDEFVAHASELISYGIYKQLGNNLQNLLSMEEIKKAYKLTISRIKSIVKIESDKYREEEREFSYNNYFKNKKCRIDYNKIANINENKELIKLLISER